MDAEGSRKDAGYIYIAVQSQTYGSTKRIPVTER